MNRTSAIFFYFNMGGKRNTWKNLWLWPYCD